MTTQAEALKIAHDTLAYILEFPIADKARMAGQKALAALATVSDAPNVTQSAVPEQAIDVMHAKWCADLQKRLIQHTETVDAGTANLMCEAAVLLKMIAPSPSPSVQPSDEEILQKAKDAGFFADELLKAQFPNGFAEAQRRLLTFAHSLHAGSEAVAIIHASDFAAEREQRRAIKDLHDCEDLTMKFAVEQAREQFGTPPTLSTQPEQPISSDVQPAPEMVRKLYCAIYDLLDSVCEDHPAIDEVFNVDAHGKVCGALADLDHFYDVKSPEGRKTFCAAPDVRPYDSLESFKKVVSGMYSAPDVRPSEMELRNEIAELKSYLDMVAPEGGFTDAVVLSINQAQRIQETVFILSNMVESTQQHGESSRQRVADAAKALCKKQPVPSQPASVSAPDSEGTSEFDKGWLAGLASATGPEMESPSVPVSDEPVVLHGHDLLRDQLPAMVEQFWLTYNEVSQWRAMPDATGAALQAAMKRAATPIGHLVDEEYAKGARRFVWGECHGGIPVWAAPAVQAAPSVPDGAKDIRK